MVFLLLACALHSTALPPRTAAADVPWLSPEAYPFTSRFFAEEGLHYLDEGSGPPVVFVHGTPTWSYEWRHQIAALRADHRVIAVDHLGFGLSDKPVEADYHPSDHARRLAALLDHLDLHDATVVVHDFGGPIGLSWVLDHPDRVSHVVILNSWMWATADDPQLVRVSRLVASPVGRYLYLDRNFSPRRMIPWSVGDGFVADESFLRPYTDVLPDPDHRRAQWQLGVDLAGASDWYGSLWDRVGVLASMDVTLIWGGSGPAFGAAALARWKGALPAAEVVELPAAGHFPAEEAPEAVTSTLRRVLAGAEGSDPTVGQL